MPDDNRFEGIGDQLGESEDDQTEPDDVELSPDSKTTTSETQSGDGPAFEFDQTKQRPIYALPAAWEQLEDALDFETKRTLRDQGVRDVPKRELHTAMLRVAAEHPEEIAEEVMRAREE